MTEQDNVGHGERIDEIKLQLQEFKLINEDNTGLFALSAFQRLVEENINIRAKCKYISSKAKQYMVRTDQLKKLQSVIVEQNSYIAEQNAFLHEAADEVESQDKQIKALVLNLDEVYSKLANNSSSNVEALANTYERAQVDFEYLEESRLLETAYYSDIVIAESILSLTADVEIVGIEKAASVEADSKPIAQLNNSSASTKSEHSTLLFNSYSEDWTEQSISGSVISYRAPNEWIAEDWQRYSFKLKQALRMTITKLKSTLKSTSDIRLGALQLKEENKRLNNLNLVLQEKLTSTQVALDSKNVADQLNQAPSNSSLQDDGMMQIGYSYSESRVEDGDNKSVLAFSESTEIPLQEYQRNSSNENLTNYSNIELIARIEELESRNKQLLQRLDREIKTKLKVEELRRSQQAELKLIKKNLFRVQEKLPPPPNNSNHIAASSSSADEVSRGSSVSSIDSSVLFMKKFPQAKATAADKLVNLSLSMSKNAEAVDRLLMGWTVTQHFKFSFSKEKVVVVDVFSRTLRIMPPRSNSNKLSGEIVELIKIHRVDKGISPSLVSKTTSKISISSCITLLLADGNYLDFELASSEERDEFFDGILGVLARFNPEFRSVDGGISYYPSFDPTATMYALENEDSIDRDLDDSSSLNSPRGSIATSSADLGKSRRLKLPRGSNAVGALKEAGVLHRRETGLRELGLISDDEEDDDDISTVLDKEYESNITGSKSTLGGWMTKRKIVDASLVRTDSSSRASFVKQNPNSIAPFPYDRSTGDSSSKSDYHNEAEILFGNIYGTPSKSKAREFGSSPAGSLSEFFTDNPISAPDGESPSPYLHGHDRRGSATKGHKKNFSLLSHLNFPDLSNITNSSSHQNSNYDGTTTAADATGDTSHSSVQHASKLLSGIQITPYSFESGYQQLNKVAPTGEGSGTSTVAAAATGFRTSASRAFAAEHAAFRRRILEGKAARLALQQKQDEQQVTEEEKEEVEEHQKDDGLQTETI